MKFNDFIWETHGIHAGTEQDHVKHGIDKLDDVVENAINSDILHWPLKVM